mmetsp:Transcript_8593/g.16636  ORF Transcript_8593/g.16636 Transcript_8593/m.16636 type:complete len:208 (-) Transcript_8593:348-971(-)
MYAICSPSPRVSFTALDKRRIIETFVVGSCLVWLRSSSFFSCCSSAFAQYQAGGTVTRIEAGAREQPALHPLHHPRHDRRHHPSLTLSVLLELQCCRTVPCRGTNVANRRIDRSAPSRQSLEWEEGNSIWPSTYTSDPPKDRAEGMVPPSSSRVRQRPCYRCCWWQIRLCSPPAVLLQSQDEERQLSPDSPLFELPRPTVRDHPQGD